MEYRVWYTDPLVDVVVGTLCVVDHRRRVLAKDIEAESWRRSVVVVQHRCEQVRGRACSNKSILSLYYQSRDNY